MLACSPQGLRVPDVDQTQARRSGSNAADRRRELPHRGVRGERHQGFAPSNPTVGGRGGVCGFQPVSTKPAQKSRNSSAVKAHNFGPRPSGGASSYPRFTFRLAPTRLATSRMKRSGSLDKWLWTGLSSSRWGRPVSEGEPQPPPPTRRRREPRCCLVRLHIETSSTDRLSRPARLRVSSNRHYYTAPLIFTHQFGSNGPVSGSDGLGLRLSTGTRRADTVSERHRGRGAAPAAAPALRLGY